MKLYLLQANDYDAMLYGIFSSEEKARESAASSRYGQQEGFVIEVAELDRFSDEGDAYTEKCITIPGIKIKKPSKWRT